MVEEKLQGKLSGAKFLLLLLLLFWVPILIEGIFSLTQMPFFTYLALGAAAYLALTVAANLIAMAAIECGRVDFRRLQDKLFSQKKQMLAHKKKYYRHAEFYKLLANVYLMSFFIVATICNVYVVGLIVAWGIHTGYTFLLTIAGLVLLAVELGFLGRLCVSVNEPMLPLYLFLSPEQYPTLIKLAYSVMEQVGLSVTFVLLAVPGCNAGVAKKRGNVYEIMVGVDLLNLLSQKELEQVLKHEFAHIKNRETETAFRLGQKKLKWAYLAQPGAAFPSFMFRPIATALSFNFDKLLFISSYDTELRADAACKKDGSRPAVNAFAKLDLFCIDAFFSPPKPTLYEQEGIPENLVAFYMDAFYARYAQNKEQWEEICLKQLPSSLDTHPNTAERMEALGESSFDVSFDKSGYDEAFTKEIETISKSFGEYLAGRMDWNTDKKYFLTEPTELTQSYLKMPVLHQEHLFVVADAFFMLGELDPAEKLFAELAEKHPTNYEIQLIYAIILSYRLDDRCVEYFIKCLDHFATAERAMERLSMYVRLRGKEELRRNHYEVVIKRYSEFVDFLRKAFRHVRKPFTTGAARTALNKRLQQDKFFLSAVLTGKKYKKKAREVLWVRIDESVSSGVAARAQRDFSWFLAEQYPDMTVMTVSDKKYERLLKNPKFCIKRAEQNAPAR